MAETILTVEDLKKYFPIESGIFKRTVGHVKAVDGVSFEIKKGGSLWTCRRIGLWKINDGPDDHAAD